MPSRMAPPATAPSADAGLDAWLDYQQQLHARPIELGLDRVRAVAERLGLLERCPLTLTIAGTNGKGSSSTLAALIYQHAGYHVGLYRSPHLLRYNERISIDGADVGDDRIVAAFVAIEHARRDVPLTYFEFGTLAALWCFRQARVDVQVLEVGLGGRLDAVNIIDADAAVVTNIGLDHQDWLGQGREAIGREKAGVFRAGRPAIVVDPAPPASLIQTARDLGALLYCVGSDYDFRPVGLDRWQWSSSSRLYPDLPLPALPGPAQLRNAAGVIAAVESLQPHRPVPDSALHSALPALQLAGRFDRRGRWWFDVAHNAEAAAALAETLQSQIGQDRPWLVLGMLSDKPVEAVAAALVSSVSGVSFVSLPGPRGLPGASLQARAASTGLVGTAFDTIEAALDEASAGHPSRPVLVTGSFLTVEVALRYLHQSGRL